MSLIPDYRLSVAPMMDWTDRHYRYFMRLITKKTLLYTEMVTTSAILRGGHKKHLNYSPEELPLALQLGGDDPNTLAECTKIAEGYGYSEINLNVGCPSERVQNGAFGACLMKVPERVGELVSKMKASTNLPVTVKHRIGVNGKESLEDLILFVRTIQAAGVDRIIIHARIAILEGLSPADNRKVPPLRYDVVYEIKKRFPHIGVVINGGINSFLETANHLDIVDGVMMGRAAYENPYLFVKADSEFYGVTDIGLMREEILLELARYIEDHADSGTKLSHVMRHELGLYYGVNGARSYRRFFSENMNRPTADYNLIHDFLKLKVRM